MSEDQIHQARAAVRGILDRAETDPDFNDRAKTDPEGVLREAGLPDDAIAEFAPRFSGQQAEVAGYLQCRWAETDCGCIGDSRNLR